MAKNITLMGASYSDVPAVNLPQTGGGTARFDDCSVVTAVASDVAQGKVFVASDGTVTTGTASGGGGSSSWTKIAETSYQVSTTSTSTETVATWSTGHSEIWTNEKWVYVRIRDTAGKRNGYFYGSDQFFLVTTTATSATVSGRFYIRTASTGNYGFGSSAGSTGYGVFADTIYPDGRIRIRKRYNSTNSLIVNGTYKVEVYLLDPAGGVPIFG